MAFPFIQSENKREFVVDTEYLVQCVEIGLQNSSISSTTNSFQFIYGDNYLDFVPRFPCAYILDNTLYQQIFQILSTSAYPLLTFLKQPSAYIVKRDSASINTSRAFRFPFFKGIPERLTYQNLSDVSVKNESFELMKNYRIDFNRIVHCLIAGSSGSGKSYALTFLISVINQFAHVTVVDPKCDSISRYCLKQNIPVLYQERDFSADEFLSKVNTLLKVELDTIYQRQAELLENPAKKFQHRCLVIDELLALTSLVSKNVKETFFALLSNIALLGRATSVHLILVSQRMDTNALPIAVREQCNFLIQLGLINRKTTTFLFPDLDSERRKYMKNINNRIIRNSTVITDKLYYLLPLELLLSFLWSLSLACIWFVNQVSTIISWDVWSQILDNFQIAQSILLQAMTIVLIIYLLAHILLCIVWIKEDTFLNFFQTVDLLRLVRKQMKMKASESDSEIVKEYKTIVQSIRCTITHEKILVIIPQAESSDIDTILQSKLDFLCNYLTRVYHEIYTFSPKDSTSPNHIIQGERISND